MFVKKKYQYKREEKQTHQGEKDAIENGAAEKDLAHMSLGLAEEKKLKSRSGRNANHLEQGHKSRQRFRRDDIIKEIAIDVGEENIEELKRYDEKSHQNQGNRSRGCARKKGVLQPQADRVGSADQNERCGHKGSGDQKVGNTPSPASACPVAGHADGRRNCDRHDGGDGGNDQPDQPVGSVQILEFKREEITDNNFHEVENKVSPQKPAKKCGDAHAGIDEISSGEGLALKHGMNRRESDSLLKN